MPYLSMTRLKLNSPLYLIPFWFHTQRVVKQMKVSEGFMKGKLLVTHNLSMWTMTLWVSEEALHNFYLSGAHRIVMGKLSEFSSEAIAGHQEVESNEFPSWEYARNELSRIGYLGKLKKPSVDHENRIISSTKIAILNIFLTPTKSVSN